MARNFWISSGTLNPVINNLHAPQKAFTSSTLPSFFSQLSVSFPFAGELARSFRILLLLFNACCICSFINYGRKTFSLFKQNAPIGHATHHQSFVSPYLPRHTSQKFHVEPTLGVTLFSWHHNICKQSQSLIERKKNLKCSHQICRHFGNKDKLTLF